MQQGYTLTPSTWLKVIPQPNIGSAINTTIVNNSLTASVYIHETNGSLNDAILLLPNSVYNNTALKTALWVYSTSNPNITVITSLNYAKTDSVITVTSNSNNGIIVSTATIYNVTMTNANTEYSQALPSKCKRFQIGTQDGSAFRLAFVTGKVATPTAPYYQTQTNEVYFESSVSAGSITLYFASASSGKVIQIIAWE